MSINIRKYIYHVPWDQYYERWVFYAGLQLHGTSRTVRITNYLKCIFFLCSPHSILEMNVYAALVMRSIQRYTTFKLSIRMHYMYFIFGNWNVMAFTANTFHVLSFLYSTMKTCPIKPANQTTVTGDARVMTFPIDFFCFIVWYWNFASL